MSDNKCGAPAMYRYTWPGKNESLVCITCALKIRIIGTSIGLSLQMIKLSNEDMLNGLTCLQTIG